MTGLIKRGAIFAFALLCTIEPSSAEDSSPPPNIREEDRGYGWALTDSAGMTLYTYLRDEPGKSNCIGVCAQLWPPISAPEGGVARGDWSVIVRADDSRQWAYRGKPLYRYQRDMGPGDTNGEELGGLWRAALRPIAAPPGFGGVSTLLGQVLSDEHQLTLYTFDRDTPNGGGCDKRCTRERQPVLASGLANPVGDFTIVVRSDGTRQWAFRGKPMYRSSQDNRASDTAGDSPNQGWRAIVLEPPAPVPAWITIQQSDAGEVFADPRGKTLYTMNPGGGRATSFQSTESDAKTPTDWEPVTADADAKRVGSWVPVSRDNGTSQWTYRGQRLYTNVFDSKPGDILGVRGSDLRFSTLTRSGVPMQGIGQ